MTISSAHYGSCWGECQVGKRPYSLNSFQLKTIASALMVLDHLRQFIPAMPLWFRYLGRVVAPVFFFLTVEGFFHTRSRPKYVARLLGAGIIMAVGSGILKHLFPTDITWHNNIFFSLGLGVALMSACEQVRETENPLLGVPHILILSIAMLFTEASIYGLMMSLTFYLFRGKSGLLALFYTIGSLMPSLLGPLTLQQLFIHDYQWMMVFALPFFLAYNGELGRGGPSAKWFFYVFYPAHLWIIYLISYKASF
ncbi:MAG: conjugal transfer protein TraX [Firmicutes bacterium]|nr:conjugal transfer protein TraX [Bacillota bacterium]